MKKIKKILTGTLVTVVSATAIGCSTNANKLAKNIDKSMAEFVTSINNLDYVDTVNKSNEKIGKIIETNAVVPYDFSNEKNLNKKRSITSTGNTISFLNNNISEVEIENTIVKPSDRTNDFDLFVLSDIPFVTMTSDDNNTSFSLCVKFSTNKIEEASSEIDEKINTLILKRSILMIYVNEIYNNKVNLTDESKVAINAYVNVLKENTSFLNGNRGMVKNQLGLASDLAKSEKNNDLVNYYIIKSGEALENRVSKLDTSISAIDSIIQIIENNLDSSSAYYTYKLSSTYDDLINNTKNIENENLDITEKSTNKEIADKLSSTLNFTKEELKNSLNDNENSENLNKGKQKIANNINSKLINKNENTDINSTLKNINTKTNNANSNSHLNSVVDNNNPNANSNSENQNIIKRVYPNEFENSIEQNIDFSQNNLNKTKNTNSINNNLISNNSNNGNLTDANLKNKKNNIEEINQIHRPSYFQNSNQNNQITQNNRNFNKTTNRDENSNNNRNYVENINRSQTHSSNLNNKNISSRANINSSTNGANSNNSNGTERTYIANQNSMPQNNNIKNNQSNINKKTIRFPKRNQKSTSTNQNHLSETQNLSNQFDEKSSSQNLIESQTNLKNKNFSQNIKENSSSSKINSTYNPNLNKSILNNTQTSGYIQNLNEKNDSETLNSENSIEFNKNYNNSNKNENMKNLSDDLSEKNVSNHREFHRNLLSTITPAENKAIRVPYKSNSNFKIN